MKSKSIIHNDDSCYICGSYPTETHHCIHGTANRRLADKDGLTVNLCHICHMNLHDKGLYDRELQKLAQTKWMEYYNKGTEEWIKRYGKSYL